MRVPPVEVGAKKRLGRAPPGASIHVGVGTLVRQRVSVVPAAFASMS